MYEGKQKHSILEYKYRGSKSTTKCRSRTTTSFVRKFEKTDENIDTKENESANDNQQSKNEDDAQNEKNS